MLKDIFAFISKILAGESLITKNKKDEKSVVNNNTVINNGDDNVTVIGNDNCVDLSPKITMENNSTYEDYTLRIDTQS